MTARRHRARTPVSGEIKGFFDGLELLDPGLVQVHRWRPGSPAPDMGDDVAGYAGVARKP